MCGSLVLTSPRRGPTLPYTPVPASLKRSSICPKVSLLKTPAPFRTMRSRTPSRGLEASSFFKRGFKREPAASVQQQEELSASLHAVCAPYTSFLLSVFQAPQYIHNPLRTYPSRAFFVRSTRRSSFLVFFYFRAVHGLGRTSRAWPGRVG